MKNRHTIILLLGLLGSALAAWYAPPLWRVIAVLGVGLYGLWPWRRAQRPSEAANPAGTAAESAAWPSLREGLRDCAQQGAALCQSSEAERSQPKVNSPCRVSMVLGLKPGAL